MTTPPCCRAAVAPGRAGMFRLERWRTSASPTS